MRYDIALVDVRLRGGIVSVIEFLCDVQPFPGAYTQIENVVPFHKTSSRLMVLCEAVVSSCCVFGM